MKRNRLRSLSVALLAVVALAPAPTTSASADELVRSDANDTPGYLDIDQLTAGHSKGERLKHSITTFDKWSSRQLGDCAELKVQLPDAKRVITIFRRSGELRARMDNPWVSPSQTVAHPKVWRRDAKTVVVSFRRSKLGDVEESYMWRATTVGPTSQRCPKGDGDYGVVVDAAPDRYSFIHRI